MHASTVLCIIRITAGAFAPRNITFRNSGDEPIHVYRVNRGRANFFSGSVLAGGTLCLESQEWESFVARDTSGIAGRMTAAHGESNIVFDIKSPELVAARKLAELINQGTPVDTAQSLKKEILELALGRVVKTSSGWNARVESFIELLRFREPLRYEEREAVKLGEDAWDSPMLIHRDSGGIAAATRHFTYQYVIHESSDYSVQPTYGTSLPLNVRVDPRTFDGKWNHHKLNNNVPAEVSECGACEMPLRSFASVALDLPMHLNTPANDPRNIVLQRQALGPDVLPFKDIYPALFSSSVLREKHYDRCYSDSTNGVVGIAGSGRGLLFHAHAAVANEALIGRKLWALYPPRNDATLPGTRLDCPWPPWNATNRHVEEALASFFYGAVPESQSVLRSCRDLRMTALQWIVYELPKLAWNQRPLLFLHHPGELLWVPESWQHATIQLDDSLYLYSSACSEPQKMPLKNRTLAATHSLCMQTGYFCDVNYCNVHHVHHPNCDAPKDQCDATAEPKFHNDLSTLKRTLKRMKSAAR